MNTKKIQKIYLYIFLFFKYLNLNKKNKIFKINFKYLLNYFFNEILFFKLYTNFICNEKNI